MQYTEPFAFQLYRQFADGKSADQLSEELGIPVDRVQARLNAAEALIKRASMKTCADLCADPVEL